MSIAENMAARQQAEALLELAGEQSQRFWEVVVERASAKLPQLPQPEERHPAMGEVEARSFEKLIVPYGKHKGEEVGCVPCGYLLFLTEGDEFSRKLRQYVKSKLFQEKQES